MKLAGARPLFVLPKRAPLTSGGGPAPRADRQAHSTSSARLVDQFRPPAGGAISLFYSSPPLSSSLPLPPLSVQLAISPMRADLLTTSSGRTQESHASKPSTHFSLIGDSLSQAGPRRGARASGRAGETRLGPAPLPSGPISPRARLGRSALFLVWPVWRDAAASAVLIVS
jgi:hypothetical protein